MGNEDCAFHLRLRGRPDGVATVFSGSSARGQASSRGLEHWESLLGDTAARQIRPFLVWAAKVGPLRHTRFACYLWLAKCITSVLATRGTTQALRMEVRLLMTVEFIDDGLELAGAGTRFVKTTNDE